MPQPNYVRHGDGNGMAAYNEAGNGKGQRARKSDRRSPSSFCALNRRAGKRAEVLFVLLPTWERRGADGSKGARVEKGSYWTREW